MKSFRFRRRRSSKSLFRKFAKKKYTWRTVFNPECILLSASGNLENPCSSTFSIPLVQSQNVVSDPAQLLPTSPTNMAQFQDKVAVVRFVGDLWFRLVPTFQISPPVDQRALIAGLASIKGYTRLSLHRKDTSKNAPTGFEYDQILDEDYAESRAIRSWQLFWGGNEKLTGSTWPTGSLIGCCSDVSQDGYTVDMSDGTGTYTVPSISTDCSTTSCVSSTDERAIQSVEAWFPRWTHVPFSFRKRIPLRENDELAIQVTFGDILFNLETDSFGPLGIAYWGGIKALFELA